MLRSTLILLAFTAGCDNKEPADDTGADAPPTDTGAPPVDTDPGAPPVDTDTAPPTDTDTAPPTDTDTGPPVDTAPPTDRPGPEDTGEPAPAGLPEDLEGAVFTVNWRAATMTSPYGLEALLEAYLDRNLLIQLSDDGAGGVELLVAPSEADDFEVQDTCKLTGALDGASYSEDDATLSGAADAARFGFYLDGSGLQIDIEQLSFSGVVNETKDVINGGTVEYLLDTRGLVELVSEDGRDDDVCDLLAGFGVSCVSCADGEEVCLQVRYDNVAARRLTDAALVPVKTECP